MDPLSTPQLTENALDIIRHFRVSDLQAILEYACVSRQGNKRELFERCRLVICSKLNSQLLNKINQINIARINSVRSHTIIVTNNLHHSYHNHQQNFTTNQPARPSFENLPIPDRVQNVHLPFFDPMRTIDCINIPVDWNSFPPLHFNITEFDIKFILQGFAKIFLRLSPTIVAEKQNDVLPPYFVVHCNGQSIINNNIVKQSGSQAHTVSFPTDITDTINLKVNVSNTITYFWIQLPSTTSLRNLPRSYTLKVQLVRCIPLDCLVSNILQRDLTFKPNNQSYDNDIEIDDTSLVTTVHRVSLICPITQTLISIPVKSVHCTHLACFNLQSFLRMNERRLQWTCPLCKKPALYENLIVDQRLQAILLNVPPNCSTVEINSSSKNLTDCHYILDNVRKDKSYTDGNQSSCQNDDDENEPKDNNCPIKSNCKSTTNDCVIISSDSESPDSCTRDEENKTISSTNTSTSHSSDLSNQKSSIDEGQHVNGSNQSSSETSIEVHNDEYWNSLTTTAYNFVPEHNPSKSYGKRTASSINSFVSNDDNEDDYHHQRKRVRQSINTRLNAADVEVIFLSSSDSSDNDDHLS